MTTGDIGYISAPRSAVHELGGVGTADSRAAKITTAYNIAHCHHDMMHTKRYKSWCMDAGIGREGQPPNPTMLRISQ